MNDGQRRRHIRDIAHLYISGSRRKDIAPHWRLVIAGEDKRSFPGFHAANLAAALAARGCDVRIHERSGLLPNAGFYFSLPPSRYIRWDDAADGPDEGLAGVCVDCAARSPETDPGEPARARVDLFHVPPLSTAEWAAVAAFRSRGASTSPTIALVVAGESGLGEIFAGTARRFEADAVAVFHTGGSAAADTGTGCGDGPRVQVIGGVAGWQTALPDRVPAVLRTPNSALAAAYFAAADAVRFKVDELRRTIVEPAAAEGSAGLRSGDPDRRPDGEGAVLPFSRFGARHSRRSSG